jgi:hypothetical protein
MTWPGCPEKYFDIRGGHRDWDATTSLVLAAGRHSGTSLGETAARPLGNPQYETTVP